MIRSARLLAWLALTCALLSGAALIAGRGLPPTAHPSMIARNPCALPCFFGVTPGQTRDQAVAALAPYQATQVSDFLVTFALVDSEGRESLASVNFDSGAAVDSVRIVAVDLLADIGTLGDLLRMGQRPQHVFRTCDEVQPVRFLLTFGAQDQLVVELFPQGDDLAPDTPITLFDLSTVASRSLYDARSSFGCSVETGWLGFAPLWKYMSVKIP